MHSSKMNDQSSKTIYGTKNAEIRSWITYTIVWNGRKMWIHRAICQFMQIISQLNSMVNFTVRIHRKWKWTNRFCLGTGQITPLVNNTTEVNRVQRNHDLTYLIVFWEPIEVIDCQDKCLWTDVRVRYLLKQLIL